MTPQAMPSGVTPDALPIELRGSLGRLLAKMPHDWQVAVVISNLDGSYTVRLCDQDGEDAGTVILWPAKLRGKALGSPTIARGGQNPIRRNPFSKRRQNACQLPGLVL